MTYGTLTIDVAAAPGGMDLMCVIHIIDHLRRWPPGTTVALPMDDVPDAWVAGLRQRPDAVTEVTSDQDRAAAMVRFRLA